MSRYASATKVQNLDRNARWALHHMEQSVHRRSSGRGGSALDGLGDTNFRVQVPRSVKRRLSNHFIASENTEEGRILYAATKGFGTIKGSVGRHAEMMAMSSGANMGNDPRGFGDDNDDDTGSGYPSPNRNTPSGPSTSHSSAANSLRYSERDMDTGRSKIQLMFDDWVKDALVNFCPVSVQSVRANELYMMIRKVVPDFTVDTHCDGIPLHVLCAQCSYLQGHGGRLHFMRIIRPTGKHNVGAASDPLNEYGKGGEGSNTSPHLKNAYRRPEEEAMDGMPIDPSERVSSRIATSSDRLPTTPTRGGISRNATKKQADVGNTAATMDIPRYLDPDSVKRSMMVAKAGGGEAVAAAGGGFGASIGRGISRNISIRTSNTAATTDHHAQYHSYAGAAAAGGAAAAATSTIRATNAANPLANNDDYYDAMDDVEEQLIAKASFGDKKAAAQLAERYEMRRQMEAEHRQRVGEEDEDGPADEDDDVDFGEEEDDTVVSEGVLAAERILQVAAEAKESAAAASKATGAPSAASNNNSKIANHRRPLTLFDVDEDGSIIADDDSYLHSNEAYPTPSPALTDTMTLSSDTPTHHHIGTQRKPLGWRTPDNPKTRLADVDEEEALMQKYYGKYVNPSNKGPTAVEDPAECNEEEEADLNDDGTGAPPKLVPWYMRNNATSVEKTPHTYAGVVGSTTTPSSSSSAPPVVRYDADGYEIIDAIPTVDEALAKAHDSVVREGLEAKRIAMAAVEAQNRRLAEEAAAAAASSTAIEGASSPPTSAAHVVEYDTTVSQEDLAFDMLMMDGEEEGGVAAKTADKENSNTPPPASDNKTSATADADADEPTATIPTPTTTTTRPRDNYFDNAFYRAEDRPESGTVSATRPDIRPFSSDEYHMVKGVMGSKSPYKGGSLESYTQQMEADADRQMRDDDDEDGGDNDAEYYMQEADAEEEMMMSGRGGSGRGSPSARRRSSSSYEQLGDEDEDGHGDASLGYRGYTASNNSRRRGYDAGDYEDTDVMGKVFRDNMSDADLRAAFAKAASASSTSSSGKRPNDPSFGTQQGGATSSSATGSSTNGGGTNTSTSNNAEQPYQDKWAGRFNEADDEVFADPEAALQDGRAMTVGLAKYEYKQAASRDGVRQGPQSWRFQQRDAFKPGEYQQEYRNNKVAAKTKRRSRFFDM